MKIKSIVKTKIHHDGFLHTRFGDHFAQISVDTTLKLKSAIKDVCRVLEGFVLPEVEALSRKMPEPPQGVSDNNFVFGYTDSGNWHPGVVDTDPILHEYIQNYPKHWAVVSKALGLARQKSRHACGFVIANRPIHEFIPTTVISDTICTAYTPASVEAVGGVKMDFLVINSLNDIAAAIAMAQQRSGLPIPEKGCVLAGKFVPSVRLVPKKAAAAKWKRSGEEMITVIMEPDEMFSDIWDLPADQKVFRDVALGRTETVFQFNTPGAIQWLRHFGHKKSDGNYAIDSIEAMSAFTALDRPGPLDMMVAAPGHAAVPKDSDLVQFPGDHHQGVTGKNGKGVNKPNSDKVQGEKDGVQHNLLVEYARRARGEEGSSEIFPFFDDLFPETYGVMVYQEQLQFAYQYLTDCSGPEAEEFRRNIAKKKMEKVLAAYPAFIERATTKLGSKDDAEKAWEFFKTWGQYGFNKSHAVCYSIIGYACAYMKKLYPLEWWTAVLRHATKEDINEKFWKHCGYLIDLPDVTNSKAHFEIVNERIQAPLSLLHGVGDKAHHQLVAGAPYTDISDFVVRIQAFKEKGATYKTVEVEKYKTDRKTKEVTTTKAMVEKKKLGASALNRGIIYTLIISGAMDSLFPATHTTLEMLGDFEEAMRAHGNKPDTKRLEKYIDLSQATRFQMRKSILPAYSTELLPIMLRAGAQGIIKDAKGNYSYSWKSFVPFASAEDIDRLGMIHPFPDDPVSFAVMGYVEGQRIFNYGEGKVKEAVDFALDISGVRKKFVKWPGRKSDKLKPEYKQNMLGGIVVVILTKYTEDKPPSVEDVIVVKQPLEEMAEVSP